MRAIVCRAFGPPESLELGDLPRPEPGRGEVALAVRAAGVAYVDGLMIRDLHQNKHNLPFAPGMEVAGEITALGAGVGGFAVGERVWGLVYDGGFAEHAVAPAAELFRLPARADFAVGAAMSSAYLTSHVALRHEARIERGETLLVLGAAGGVGLAAVDIGKALGATVIAAASSPERLALAAARGADHLVDYTREDLRARVAEITDAEGVDVVYDPVAGDLHEPAFRSLGWGGRYLVIGFAGGAIPKVPANHILVKNRRVLGMALFYYRKRRPDLLRASADELAGLYDSGRLDPAVTARIGLEGVPGAIRAIMDRKLLGKAVVEIGQVATANSCKSIE